MIVDEKGTKYWVLNIITDVALCMYFLVYCRNVHRQSPTQGASWFWPKDSFVVFPKKRGVVLTLLFMINLYAARVPAIYYSYQSMDADDGSGNVCTYSNALLLITLSIVPIFCYAQFWSISYLLFRKEFTAAPGCYNAIHDPMNNMVAVSMMVEGAMDVISATQLMELATYSLPGSVNGAVVIFSMLELFNGCSSFGFLVSLSGGHDDTPQDLVRWKAYMKFARLFVEFACFFLRMVLWVQYNAVSSVFLVKNLFSLIHAFNQCERYAGARTYTKRVLFNEYVPPQDWYGLTKEEFKVSTMEPLLDITTTRRK
jgi:hypothetical protein